MTTGGYKNQEFLYLEVDDSDKEFEEPSRQHVIHVKHFKIFAELISRHY
jgi:hypothetical protein